MNIQTYQFANNVKTDDDALEYLKIFMEENGTKGLIQGLNHLAKSKSMTNLAKQAGLNRQSLYRTLSENGNPKLQTIDKIITALGYKLTIEKV
ncbi:MAG: putative addiction module antidote protein [Methylococcales bacterium]|jgi:probable addiction module antidote protein|nr:putative addiction module antidote protein [Methylococcales bacterium]MBT7410954.1 putative addiction module antidote protein [Methylococcales bacterium]